MRLNLIALCFLAALPSFAKDSDERLMIVGPAGQATLTLKEFKEKLPVVTFTVDHPDYNKVKTFDGFDLKDVLKLSGVSTEGADEIAFQAKDGYTPAMPISQLQGHRAILAFREHGLKSRWQKVPQGKTLMDPSPFYVIWTEGKQLPDSYPRPYQLVKIELVKFATKFSKLYPHDAKPGSAVMKGFAHFKALCLNCHSINLQGGEIGPELNVPRNVTEYWKHGELKAFVRNARSFRARSKMPPFEQELSAADVDDIFEYLEDMKDHKIQN